MKAKIDEIMAAENEKLAKRKNRDERDEEAKAMIERLVAGKDIEKHKTPSFNMLHGQLNESKKNEYGHG